MVSRFVHETEWVMGEWFRSTPIWLLGLLLFLATVASVYSGTAFDAERKAVRRSRIPTTIVAALIFYVLVAAAVLGGLMKTRKGRQFSIVLLALNILALMLVVDINRSVEGTIHEPQQPMEWAFAQIETNPPAVYQRLSQQQAQ